jgi:hypothetical protein
MIRRACLRAWSSFARGRGRFSLDWATFIAAVLTLVAAIYFGFYPRQPREPVLDPGSIYRGGKSIGQVMDFNVEPVFSGQFVFRITPSARVEMGTFCNSARPLASSWKYGPKPPRPF